MKQRKHTILVCEDDPATRLLISHILEQHGYHARVVAWGEQVVRIASEGTIDLILLDLFMPGISGWEVVAAVRSEDSTATLPIVVVSSLSPRESETASHSVQGWVEKPIDAAKLVSVVDRVFRLPTVHSPRILVVEDNDMTASLLQALLERHGVGFYRARDGVEAIEIASWLRPDLVVLDVMLPDMDGFSVIKWLRKHEQLRSTPVIVYSGANITEADRTRLELGPTEFVAKGQFPIRTVEQKALQILAGMLGRDRPVEAEVAVN